MTRWSMVALRAFAAVLGWTWFASGSARAQLFSNKDGYTADGAYRVQVELAPYLWLPATSGHVGFASALVANRLSGNFSTGIPSASTLADSLHGAFMGAGLLRYGPYSGEIDIQYVNASASKTFFTGPNGFTLRLHASTSLVRVAPGAGYQVFSGELAGVPVSADARVGFAYFATSSRLKGEESLSGDVSGSSSFWQPWIGGRFTVVPAPRWRVELGVLLQGLGVDGGSLGWGASLIGSYAFTDWAAANFGVRALASRRDIGDDNQRISGQRSISLTAYGPVAGVSFRF
jgi:hypothetical protein